MTPELWIVLLAGAVPGLIGLAGAVVAIVFATGERKARIAGEQADTKKTHVEIDTLTSGEWKRLYDEMCRRIEKQDIKIDKQDVKIEKVGNELDIAKDYIQYLWLGTVENIHYMEKANMTPPFKPELNFRGDSDFDIEDWKWLDE